MRAQERAEQHGEVPAIADEAALGWPWVRQRPRVRQRARIEREDAIEHRRHASDLHLVLAQGVRREAVQLGVERVDDQSLDHLAELLQRPGEVAHARAVGGEIGEGAGHRVVREGLTVHGHHRHRFLLALSRPPAGLRVASRAGRAHSGRRRPSRRPSLCRDRPRRTGGRRAARRLPAARQQRRGPTRPWISSAVPVNVATAHGPPERSITFTRRSAWKSAGTTTHASYRHCSAAVIRGSS